MRVKSAHGKDTYGRGQLVLDHSVEKVLRTEHRGSGRRQRAATVGGQQLSDVRRRKYVRRRVSRPCETRVVQLCIQENENWLVGEVLMAKAKTCKNSKGCGSSCISSGYLCQIDIPEAEAKKLDQFSDALISRGSVIKTPEQAAQWWEDNKEVLASDTKSMRNYGHSNPDMLMVSTEFGGDPAMTSYTDTGKIQSRFEKVVKAEDQTVPMPMSKGQIKDWYTRNPVAWTNYHEQELKGDLEVNKGNKSLIPRVDTGLVLATKSGKNPPSVGRVDTVEGWGQVKQKYFQRTAKLAGEVQGVKTMGTINLSPIRVNTADNWPLKNLPLPKGSPLASREKWLQYSSERLAKSTVEHVKNNPTKVIYVSGNTKAHTKFFDTLHKGLNGSSINTNNQVKERNNASSVTIKRRSFTYVDPRTGAKHVVVQGMHPSAQSFSNEELAIIAAMMNSGLG